MENSKSISTTIIETINLIFEKLLGSIDNSLYDLLDDIIFISPNILQDKNFETLFGTSSTSGILLISNSLLLGVILYFSIKFLLSHLTACQLETPYQFIFKLIIFGICMNFSYFILEQLLSLFFNLSFSIINLGEYLFNESISFSSLITKINTSIYIDSTSIDIFSLDGFLKSIISLSLLTLVFSYSFRYIMVKIFLLLAPFAFLSLSLNNTSWFFKAWLKNIFAMLFIQIIVALVLLILFSFEYSSTNLLSKFIYIGGIYALIRASSFVREFIGGVSTVITQNVNKFIK